MVHFFYLCLGLVIALASFFGGFKYSEPNTSFTEFVEKLKVTAKLSEAEPEIKEPLAEPEPAPEPIVQPPQQDTQTLQVPHPEPVKPSDTTTESEPVTKPISIQSDTSNLPAIERRALQEWYTFSDKQGRTLEAQVISIDKDTMRIRRRSDDQIISFPISILSEEDRTFAIYLRRRQPYVLKQKETEEDQRFESFAY